MKSNSPKFPSMAVKLTRFQTGSSLVEALCALALLVPLVLVALDACVLIEALNFNETVCRNAARSASMGAPDALVKGEPLKNALGIVANAVSDGGYVRISPILDVSETVTKPLPFPPFGGSVNGEVTVSTTCLVFLPFTGTLLRQGPVKLRAKKVYAYSYTLPAQTTSFKN